MKKHRLHVVLTEKQWQSLEEVCGKQYGAKTLLIRGLINNFLAKKQLLDNQKENNNDT